MWRWPHGTNGLGPGADDRESSAGFRVTEKIKTRETISPRERASVRTIKSKSAAVKRARPICPNHAPSVHRIGRAASRNLFEATFISVRPVVKSIPCAQRFKRLRGFANGSARLIIKRFSESISRIAILQKGKGGESGVRHRIEIERGEPTVGSNPTLPAMSDLILSCAAGICA